MALGLSLVQLTDLHFSVIKSDQLKDIKENIRKKPFKALQGGLRLVQNIAHYFAQGLHNSLL